MAARILNWNFLEPGHSLRKYQKVFEVVEAWTRKVDD